MPKRYGIQWTDLQKKELNKQVKRFNDKLAREIKKNPDFANFFPNKLSVKTLKQEIETAGDLKQLKSGVNIAFKKDIFTPVLTKQGIATTNYEIAVLKKDVAKINRERKKRLEMSEPSTLKGTMGTIKSNNLLPKKFDLNALSYKNWDAFLESVKKQSKSSYTASMLQTYKSNYIDLLTERLGSKAQPIIDIVSKLAPQIVYDAYFNDPVLEIGFLYDPQQIDTFVIELLIHWKTYLNIPFSEDEEDYMESFNSGYEYEEDL